MPELPEIETVTRGIETVRNRYIYEVIVRNGDLRYKITQDIANDLINKQVVSLYRRAKYIIFELTTGYLIIHLGMSGSLSLLNISEKNDLYKHDHVDIILGDLLLRFNDPRRFGCVVYTDDCTTHPIFATLGVEPLTEEFNAQHLYDKVKNKKSSIKQLIMDNSIVVGVGNIYASEALFLAKISPLRKGCQISQQELVVLVTSIKHVLTNAIEQGGSSLRDYKQADGSLGYFQNSHLVYDKTGQNCTICDNLIVSKRLGQRNSFYCPNCQK